MNLSKNSVRLAVLYSLLSLTSGISYADHQPSSIFELSLQELLNLSVVSGASGFEQRSTQAPAAVSVVTREEWQAMGARSVTDVINYISGAHVSEDTVGLAAKKISLRGVSGASAQQVKILLDGRSLNYIADGGLMPGHRIPLSGLKRIEVIKGPGSAIYGADAFGGVVNLVSLSADDKTKSFRASAGNWRSRDIAVEYGGHNSDIQWHVSGEYQTSEGDLNRVIDSDLQSMFDFRFGTDASDAPNAFASQYEVITLNGQLNLDQLDIDYFHTENRDVGTGAGTAQALDSVGVGDFKQDILGLSYDITKALPLPGYFTLNYDYQRQTGNSYLHVFPEGTVLPIGSDGNINVLEPVGIVSFPDGYIGTPGNDSTKQAVRAIHLFEKRKHYLRWELGAEKIDFEANERKNFGPGIINGTQGVVDGTLTDVTGTEFIYMAPQTRDIYYLSLQDEWRIQDNLQFTFGLRYDEFSDFGSTMNPRASLIWNANNWLDIKTFAGTAFRAPSFADLYAQNNPAAIGNPELKPETIDTYELAFSFDFLENHNISTNINLYQYKALDIITYIANDDGVQFAQNTGSQQGQGVEFELFWSPIENVKIKANYAKLRSEDAAGNTIPFEAHTLAKLSMNWAVGNNVSLFTGFRFVGDRYREANDSRTNMINDYWLADTKITFSDILAGGDVSLVVNNIFNHDARDPSNGAIVNDFPLNGRQYLLEYAIVF